MFNMCINIYMYIYIHTYTYVYAYVRMYVYIYIYIYVMSDLSADRLAGWLGAPMASMVSAGLI